MSNTFTNQTVAQIELENVVPTPLDEKVARLHPDSSSVRLTTLTREQAEYIGVAVEGPYKPDHYRY